jgi:hypothetical protein
MRNSRGSNSDAQDDDEATPLDDDDDLTSIKLNRTCSAVHLATNAVRGSEDLK